jgi:hypothetical protein
MAACRSGQTIRCVGRWARGWCKALEGSCAASGRHAHAALGYTVYGVSDFTVAVHIGVANTDFWHVASIYVGTVFTAVSLALSQRFLTAASPPARLMVLAPV